MNKFNDYFKRSEFSCKCGCGMDTVDYMLIVILTDLRDEYGKCTITSGCRCEQHNKDEGGADKSQHLFSRGADVYFESGTPEEWADFVKLYYPSASVGLYSNRIHVDTRTNGPAFWDAR